MTTLAERAKALAAKEVPEMPQSVLVYGAPKTGKTALVGQLARKYKVIWLDIDRGSQTLFTAVPQEFWHNITVVDIFDTPTDPVAVKTLTAIVKNRGILKICAGHGAVNCVHPSCRGKPNQLEVDFSALNTETVLVCDALSNASDSAMAHALGQQGDFVFKKKEYTHYDNQGLLLRNILTWQKLLRCHRVFISHEEEIQHEDGTRKITPVGGTRNFAKKLGGSFDHMVYTSVRAKKYCISSLATSDMKVQAGNRNNKDIKNADDFVNIFSVQHILDGKTSDFNFSHEASMIAEEEAEAATKSADAGN